MGYVAGNRRHADERTATSGDHVRHGVLEAQHGAQHIEVQGADELSSVLQVVRPEARSAASIGDATVERTGWHKRGGHDALDIVFVGDVAGYVMSAATVTGGCCGGSNNCGC